MSLKYIYARTAIVILLFILSRVSVTETRVWIGELVYWIFTSRNYSSYTLKIIITTACVTSHTKSSNSSSGHTVFPLELRNSSEVNSKVKSKSHCDWRSVGQSVLVSSPHLGLMTRYLLLFDSYSLVIVGRPLWREDGSVFYQSHCLH
jgi:hypothetical protein